MDFLDCVLEKEYYNAEHYIRTEPEYERLHDMILCLLENSGQTYGFADENLETLWHLAERRKKALLDNTGKKKYEYDLAATGSETPYYFTTGNEPTIDIKISGVKGGNRYD